MINYEISGDLVSENIKHMKSEILDLMEKTDQIILDFSETNYIDSIGLGMLVSLYKESISNNISIRIKNANENVRKLFRITALDELFINENWD